MESRRRRLRALVAHVAPAPSASAPLTVPPPDPALFRPPVGDLQRGEDDPSAYQWFWQGVASGNYQSPPELLAGADADTLAEAFRTQGSAHFPSPPPTFATKNAEHSRRCLRQHLFGQIIYFPRTQSIVSC